MNLWEAMEACGWIYDRRANVYRKDEAVVSYAQAEQAYRDALVGVDRSKPSAELVELTHPFPANENEEGGDAEADAKR